MSKKTEQAVVKAAESWHRFHNDTRPNCTCVEWKMPKAPKFYQSDRDGTMCEVGTGIELLTDDVINGFIKAHDYEKLRTFAAALTVQNESLRAECGLRHIQGYNEGKAVNEQDAELWRNFMKQVGAAQAAGFLGTSVIVDDAIDAAPKEPKT